MGLFGFGNKNKVGNNAPASRQGAEWQQLQNVEFQGNQAAPQAETRQDPVEMAQRNGERQRRKIVAVLLTGMQDRTPETRNKMANILNTHDVNVSAEQYDTVIDMMARGQIGRAQGREVISMIQRPVDRYGSEEVFRRIENGTSQSHNSAEEVKHMKRILGSFSGAGFYGYEQTNAKNVEAFLKQFPDAMSFDQASEEFLDSIHNRNNSPQKIKSYYESMIKFKDLMYGNEQKYLDQYKLMERQAGRKRAEMERQRERLVTGYAEKQVSRAAVRARRGMLKRADLLKPGAQRRSEYEIDLAREPEQSEDTCLSLPEQGIFAVFDGAGGVQNGRAASRRARDSFMAGRPETTSNASQLAQMMEMMNANVLETGGMSTGLVAKVNRDQRGNKYLSFASVGDSRLYILHKNGRLDSWTRDEGERNRVWNMLGMRQDHIELSRNMMGVTNKRDICLQHQDVLLNDGDRVIMCSDGITGDNPPEPELGKKGDLLSDQEVRFLATAPTAEQAAENLLVGAKKIDDRSVVVFDV